MSKIERVLGEVGLYFGTVRGDGYALVAQSFEPRSSVSYTPEADNRLVRMMNEAKYWSKSDQFRIKKVVDELPASVISVLRLAFWNRRDEIGSVLPSAAIQIREKGLDRDLKLARCEEKMVSELSDLYAALTKNGSGTTPFSLITSIFRRIDELEWLALGTELTPADTKMVARLAIKSGAIDVSAEVNAIIEGACDIYLAMRERLEGTKRAHKAQVRQESAESFDDMMGKKKRKSRARFESTEVGRELVAMHAEIVAAIEQLALEPMQPMQEAS